MAREITRIEKRQVTQAEKDAQALGELLGAVAKHKDALIKFADIVGEMNEAGLLDVAQGVLKNRQQIGVLGITQMNKSGAQRFIKNSMSAVQFLGQLEPEHLKEVLGAVAHGLEQARPENRNLGMWGMVSRLRDPDVNSSISVMMNFLRGMGEALPHQQRQ